MNNSSIICVCGAGTMGSGIAQVCASAGFTTILYELNEAVLAKAKTSIEKSLQTLVEKNKITAAQQQDTINHLTYTNNIAACKADLIIEAIIEKPEIKVQLFNQLAEINSPKTIFASNTSSLSITHIAEKILHPERVAGLHFFNPAPLMKLVEVVHTSFTNKNIIDELVAFTKQLGKTPVVCKDSPGFIVNRVARPFYIEALRIAEEGNSSFEDIDEIMEASGFKMGPFKLMDLIGNDVNFAVSTSVYEQLGNPPRLKPSFIQQQKVENGELGKKTGKGYYNYS